MSDRTARICAAVGVVAPVVAVCWFAPDLRGLVLFVLGCLLWAFSVSTLLVGFPWSKDK